MKQITIFLYFIFITYFVFAQTVGDIYFDGTGEYEISGPNGFYVQNLSANENTVYLTGGAGTYTVSTNSQNWDVTVESGYETNISSGVGNGSFTITAITKYYRTVQPGNWSATSIWESSADGISNWTPATETPTASNSAGITINSNVVVDADVSIDQTTVDAAATLSVATGQTLTVANGDGTDLAITGTFDLQGSLVCETGSRVEYNGGNQTIAAADYQYLGFDGSSSGSIKTFADGVTKIESEVVLDETVTICGSSAANVTVQVTTPYAWDGTSGDGLATISRIFRINALSKTVTIKDITMYGGNISTLTGSSAYGGAILVEHGILYVENCNISGAKAINGGAICHESTSLLSITQCELSNNYAELGNGGGISVTSSANVSIAETIFNANQTSSGSGETGGYGGGFYCEGEATIEIAECTFKNNDSYWNGGGISLHHASLDAIIVNSTFYNNSATNWGGGLMIDKGSANVSNCTFSHNFTSNSAKGGGGIAVWSVSSTFRNNTIANNSSSGRGAGLFFDTDYSGSYSVCNCIIANNSGNGTGDDFYNNGATLIDNGYNIIEVSNIAANATGSFNHQTSILFNTKYINSGTSYSSWTQGGISVSGVLELATSLANNGGVTQTLALGATSFAAASTTTGIPSANNWNNSPQINGEYTDQRGVVRTANQNTSIGAYSENIPPPQTYYVDASKNDDSGDGLSWATAKQTIQAAINLASAGDSVLVNDGTYNIASTICPTSTLLARVIIDTGIIVKSVNGAEYTIIEGAPASGGGCGTGAIRGVYLSSSSQLIGFKITNGYTHTSGLDSDRSGGGVYSIGGDIEILNCIIDSNSAYYVGGGIFVRNGGSITNCRIENNTQVNPGGAGGGGMCIGHGPTAIKCIISNNTAYGSSGGAGVFMFSDDASKPVRVYNSLIINNRTTGSNMGGGITMSTNGTNNAAVLDNCTVVGNTAEYGGGIMTEIGAIVNNCIVWGNTAGDSGNDINAMLGGTVTYTCASDGVTNGVNDCITTNPVLADTANNDYRLSIGSPAIDVGDNTIDVGTTDLAGNPRRDAGGNATGSGDGTIDMGAYEYTDSGNGNFETVSSGNWFTPSVWDINAVPSISDTVIINNTHTVTVSASAIITNVKLKAGAVIELNGNSVLTINGDLFDAGGIFNIESGSKVIVQGDIKNENGELKLEIGSLQGFEINGDVDVEQPVSVTDIEGNVYSIVTIGNQVWMAENLKVTKDPQNNSITRYCYNDNSANCNIYGGLYDWNTMMKGSSSSSLNPSNVQGICPDGWHIPSDSEWTELTNLLGGASVAGGKLKDSGTEHWSSPNTDASNSSGFTALPGGSRSSGFFSHLGNYGLWWTSTQYSSTSAINRNMSYSNASVGNPNNNKTMNFAVRCLKD